MMRRNTLCLVYMPYVFDLNRLDRIASEDGPRFRAAEPYPHIVIDEFLEPAAAAALADVFPAAGDDVGWDYYAAAGLEVKMGTSREERFPEPLRRAIHEMNAGPFVRFVERLSGIDHLLPDPHLAGGGLHLTRAGGLLGVHADFNWHERLQAHRRLNLLIYLGRGWRPGFGGELELWDTAAKGRVRTIEPLFNRAVLFTTRSDSFHGHPAPWSAPEGIERQSIALYYYTSARPEEELRAPHSTIYKGYHID
ncbi:2OG-Fe(II) oxygenase [Dokdonella koreensis]|nr:2OG-Fe(II) oxygenase [Dokdonella koreensis]